MRLLYGAILFYEFHAEGTFNIAVAPGGTLIIAPNSARFGNAAGNSKPCQAMLAKLDENSFCVVKI